MRKKIEWKWEKLDESTSRVKVIGGWLICCNVVKNDVVINRSTSFISDINHEWTIIEEKTPVQSTVNNLSSGY